MEEQRAKRGPKPGQRYNPNEYKKDAVYTASKDTHGHYETWFIKFPEGMKEKLYEIVRDNVRFPQFRTESDFVRNAMIHALHNELDPNHELDASLLNDLRKLIATEHLKHRAEQAELSLEYVRQAERALALFETREELAELWEDVNSYIESGVETGTAKKKVEELLARITRAIRSFD